MPDGLLLPFQDHRSDRRKRPMIYFLVDEHGICKIGTAIDVRKRLAQHATSNPHWRFYCAIEGGGTEEHQIHDYFAAYALEGARSPEMFRLEGAVLAYIEWLGTRAFAACSLDELDDVWPHPHRFPWTMEGEGVVEHQMSLDGLTEIVPGIRKPLSRSKRIVATIRSDSDEWYTPPIYVEAARRVMGRIDLDPSSSPLANRTVKATAILTAADDGLRYQWKGRVWMNPPFGGVAGDFVAHLIREIDAGRVTEATVCVNANSAGTIWFQPLWEWPLCFTHHRPRFIGGARNKGADDVSPTTGIVFGYWGPNEQSWVDEFSQFGNVVRRCRPPSMTSEEFRQLIADGSDWGVA